MWMCRDPRLLVCRALFLLVPCAWLGYAVGVTNNLSFKDLLLQVNEEIDDISTREEIDKADIALLHTYLRIGLGVFMLLMSLFVLIGACIGGMNRYCCPTRSGGSHAGCQSAASEAAVGCAPAEPTRATHESASRARGRA